VVYIKKVLRDEQNYGRSLALLNVSRLIHSPTNGSSKLFSITFPNKDRVFDLGKIDIEYVKHKSIPVHFLKAYVGNTPLLQKINEIKKQFKIGHAYKRTLYTGAGIFREHSSDDSNYIWIRCSYDKSKIITKDVLKFLEKPTPCRVAVNLQYHFSEKTGRLLQFVLHFFEIIESP
jgi:hypothetical protein